MIDQPVPYPDDLYGWQQLQQDGRDPSIDWKHSPLPGVEVFISLDHSTGAWTVHDFGYHEDMEEGFTDKAPVFRSPEEALKWLQTEPSDSDS